MNYIIAIKGNITSFVFFNEVIPKLHTYFSDDNQEPILFDFTSVKTIDPLVLPNLLCTGFLINEHRGVSAQVFVPSNLESLPLRTFLHRTGFVKFAQTYNLFEFNASISGGVEATAFHSTLNKIELFQGVNRTYAEGEDGFSELAVDRTKEQAWEQLTSSFIPFIKEFLQRSNERYILTNREAISSNLLFFCREVVENALLHGRSFCFLNMQYSSSFFGKQIKISISDCGVGFRKSINADRSRSLKILALQKRLRKTTIDGQRKSLEKEIAELRNQGYPLSDEDIDRLAAYPYLENELEGIVYGLLSRSQKPYGLYSIYNKIIHALGGTIRIHSNDTQLVLSERMWAPLAVCKTPKSLLVQLAKEQYAVNIRTDLTFKGAHIEMEFLLDDKRE